MTSLLKELLSFVMACMVTIFVLVFVLRLPQYITQNPSIVNEYYFKGFLSNVPLDLFFIFVYLQIALLVAKLLQIKSEISIILVVAIVTFFITSGFCLYFQSYPMTKSFFSRWFHQVGYNSAIYDVILLVVTYITYRLIQKTI
jgi:hypothetical protein